MRVTSAILSIGTVAVIMRVNFIGSASFGCLSAPSQALSGPIWKRGSCSVFALRVAPYARRLQSPRFAGSLPPSCVESAVLERTPQHREAHLHHERRTDA